jgi:acyl-CoA synthetase (AMP-forming)/AMP-acid ligase II
MQIDGTTGESYTYRDLYDKSIEVAKALNTLGVRQNDTVAIISENRIEYIPIGLGITLLNSIAAPINLTYTERKNQYYFVKK